MKKLFVMFSLMAVIVLAATAAMADQPAPLSTPDLKKTIGSGKKCTVVFFLNPNGGPCRAQNEVLTKLQKDRKNNFNIVYVSAMDQANQQAFYDYGIRSLPQIVIVNSRKNISRVFPPGIQEYGTLAAALDGAK